MIKEIVKDLMGAIGIIIIAIILMMTFLEVFANSEKYFEQHFSEINQKLETIQNEIIKKQTN